MFTNLFPDQYLNSVYDIDYPALKHAGITSLIFDIDNTLAPFDIAEPFPQTIRLFGELHGLGFNICLLSNNSYARVEAFNQALGVHSVARAGKPGRRGLDQALGKLGSSTSTALIGDQLFTDVWCSKRNGLLSILVKPVSPRDELPVKAKRFLEIPIMKLYLWRVAASK
ncbi:MAG: YqeG family HAD IIIA-type phosphatase [Defluviitaleaceae bacterium]|nr:YqeG family HAD IIIA-type phosphatase [Defluviitaleaceae bacterium]